VSHSLEPSRKVTFQVVAKPGANTLYIECASPMDANKWVEHLTKVIGLYQEGKLWI